MEAASLLAMSASDEPTASKKKRKRGEKKAKEAANKRKRRKTLSSGDLADGDDEEDGDGDGGIDDDDQDITPELRWRRSAASRLVLSALRRCFQSDRSGFVNKTRFDLLLPAVVAQLECGSDFSAASAGFSASGGETPGAVEAAPERDEVSSCRLHAEELVGPCLAQLASASGKDALWKAMANAVLMKTRSKRAGVRVAALVSLRQCFEVIGEEFLALLPECLPFLSELLEVSHEVNTCLMTWATPFETLLFVRLASFSFLTNLRALTAWLSPFFFSRFSQDGHPEVESECRALVKYIEGILGESIESYLV